MPREIALVLLAVMATMYTLGMVFQMVPNERTRERWKRQPSRPPDALDHFMAIVLVFGLWAFVIKGLVDL